MHPPLALQHNAVLAAHRIIRTNGNNALSDFNMPSLQVTVAGLVIVVFLSSGCRSVQSPPPNAFVSVEEGDKVLICFGDGSLVLGREVDKDGIIRLPLIGPFVAGGKTPKVVETEVLDAYRKSGLINPFQMSIAVRRPPPCRVLGEVGNPGVIRCTNQMTIVKAIETCGGFTERANKKRVKLRRQNGRTIIVDCAKAIDNPSLDLLVFPDDRIQVRRN